MLLQDASAPTEYHVFAAQALVHVARRQHTRDVPSVFSALLGLLLSSPKASAGPVGAQLCLAIAASLVRMAAVMSDGSQGGTYSRGKAVDGDVPPLPITSSQSTVSMVDSSDSASVASSVGPVPVASPAQCAAALDEAISALRIASPGIVLRLLEAMAEEVFTGALSPPLRAAWSSTLKHQGVELVVDSVRVFAETDMYRSYSYFSGSSAVWCACVQAWLHHGFMGWGHMSLIWEHVAIALRARIGNDSNDTLFDVCIAVVDLHHSQGCAAVLASLLSHQIGHNSLCLARLLLCCARSSLRCSDQANESEEKGGGGAGGGGGGGDGGVGGCNLAMSTSQSTTPHTDLHLLWPSVYEAALSLVQSEQWHLFSMALEFWEEAVACREPNLSDDILQRVVYKALTCSAYPTEYIHLSVEAREAFHDARNDFRNALRPMVVARPVILEWLETWAMQALGQIGSSQAGDLRKDLLSHEQWASLEAVVHALTAVARSVFDAKRVQQRAIQCVVVEGIARLPLLPGLQRTAIMLLGLLSDWLEKNSTHLSMVLFSVLRSLQLHEHHTVYPMRLNEDHVGAVALVKLTRTVPRAHPSVAFELYAQLAVTYQHLCATCDDSTRALVTKKSARLVLQSLCQVVGCLTADMGALERGEEVCRFVMSGISPLVLQLKASEASPAHAYYADPSLQLFELLKDLEIVMQSCTGAAWLGAAHALMQGCSGEGCLRVLLVHVAHKVSTLPLAVTLGSPSSLYSPSGLLSAVPTKLSENMACIMEGARKAVLAAVVHAPREVSGDHFIALCMAVSHVFAEGFQLSPCPEALEVFRCVIEALSASVNPQVRTAVGALAAELVQLVARTIAWERLGMGAVDIAFVEQVFTFFACVVRISPQILPPDFLSILIKSAAQLSTNQSRAGQEQASARAIVGFLREVLCVLQTSDRGGSQNNTGDITAVLDTGAGALVIHALLAAASGGMPGWMLDDIVGALRAVYERCGAVRTREWLMQCMAGETFVRRAVGPQARLQFAEDLTRAAAVSQWQRFKNTIKHFCGGKRKGTEGTPTK